MKNLGFALLIVGLVALVFGGIEFDRQRTILQISSMSATVTEHQASPVALLAGLFSMGCGVVLLLTSQKRRRA